MRQSEINAIKQKAFDFNDRVRCQDVLNLIGYNGKTRRHGSSLYFQCLNGCDPKAKLDKCSIYLDKNYCKCFSCGESFGPTKLFAKALDVSYTEASLLLAKEFGGITEDEYSSCTKSKVVFNKLVSDSATYSLLESKMAEETAEFHAPKDTVDLVYRHMLALPEFRLDKIGIEHLLKRRCLSIEDITKGKFFSYTKGFSIDVLVANIRKEKPDFKLNDLLGVPGFYFEYSNPEKTKGHWCFKQPYAECLGIPLLDSSGRISALQMRMLKAGKGAKYFFVTSKSMNEKGNYSFGSSSGSPAHVEYPDIITNPMVFIGEGKFKMLEASKEGSVSFSCQGVGNYKFVVEEISEMFSSELFASKLKPGLTADAFRQRVSFLIMYDADMYHNISVLQAGQGLSKALQTKFPGCNVSFLLWDEARGKGFDDLKHKMGADFKAYTKVIKAADFCSIVDDALKSADAAFLRDYPTDKNKNFRNGELYKNYLQKALWDNRIKRIVPSDLKTAG